MKCLVYYPKNQFRYLQAIILIDKDESFLEH